MDKLHIKIRLWDWILILGIIFAPMTGLRVWKIGPGELLCMLWSTTSIYKFCKTGKLKNTIITKMFAAFLLSLCAGTLIGRIVAPNQQVITDLFTWIYLALIAVFVFQRASSWSKEYITKVTETALILSSIWYLFLYIYSITISRKILGAPLWYSNSRFSGGATNPHQIAMFFCIAFIYFFFNVIEKKKVIYLILALSTLFLLIQTKATTGYAAIVLGMIVYLITPLLKMKKRKKDRWRLLIIIAVFALITAVLSWKLLLNLLLDFLNSDANGSSRLIIFSNIGNTFSLSPIFGLGPGTHSFWPGVGMMEYHNTYLEVLAETGIVGEIVLLWFFLRIIKSSMSEPKYLSVFVSIFVYCAAGFVMRRLIFWVYICLFLAYLEKSNIKSKVDEVCTG